MSNKESTNSNLKSNKLADLIWTIYENHKSNPECTHKVIFEELPNTDLRSETLYRLTYIDNALMYSQPFLTTENATTQVQVTSSDFHFFIESLNAKNIAIELLPPQEPLNLTTEVKEDRAVQDEAVEVYSESKEFLYTILSLIVGLIVVVCCGLLGSFVSPWIPFFVSLTLVSIGIVYVNRVLDKKA